MKKIQKIAMVISNVVTKETLERWDFRLQYDQSCTIENGTDDVAGKKDIKVIQNEIRDVLRQICSTVSFLPLLDCPCKLVYFYKCVFMCVLCYATNWHPKSTAC